MLNRLVALAAVLTCWYGGPVLANSLLADEKKLTLGGVGRHSGRLGRDGASGASMSAGRDCGSAEGGGQGGAAGILGGPSDLARAPEAGDPIVRTSCRAGHPANRGVEAECWLEMPAEDDRHRHSHEDEEEEEKRARSGRRREDEEQPAGDDDQDGESGL